MAVGSADSALTTVQRLYVYALHGFLIEVLFTAAWDFCHDQQWTLIGCSNVWSLPIYGVSGLVMESLASMMQSRGLSWPIRGLIYLTWIYIWEFSTGLALRQVNACPWDYSERRYNVAGLITFEYAPLWTAISLIMEQSLIMPLSTLRWSHHKPD